MSGGKSPIGHQGGDATTDPPADTEAPADLVTGFWTLILLVKVGVLVLGAGVVAIVLTDHEVAGVALIALGGLVVARWVMTYRRVRDRYGTKDS